MAEYIDRSVGVSILRAKANMAVLSDAAPYFEKAAQMLEKLPAAEVAPVVHGHWIDKMVRDWHCSECNYQMAKIRNFDGYCYDDKPNFCPNCGADMRGGRVHDQ